MPFVVVSYSERDGEIFTASLRDVAYAAWQAVTGGGISSFVGLINPAIISAEEGQPEGTKIEMVISGWSNPLTGTDYSADVANYLNSQWYAGYILNSEGVPVIPWPEYPYQIAWGGGDQIVLRWVKGGIGGPFLLLWAAAAIVIIGLIAVIPYTRLMSPWRMSVEQKTQEISGPSWWDRLSTVEKAAIIAGGTVAAMFLLWYLAERSIAQAGAPQIVVTSGG